ncbi:uncharacterized protein B0H18DRAFT_1125327 [Fomitopsis serialis]|uniref:uncharacterized protein n=1 Tax=Fomitopsis serialis TaxID=139415 RepID=UPI0020085033|nr:uncharacterized protein B0H18DRAFT_1125327 [Neoantrodia serialis]KAH9914744.1 hypothetical protein B0H18DRAFT_1125327 [Neoantrodia serialis]
MSDLQPSSHLPPSPDVSHAQLTQWSADGHTNVGQSSASEQSNEEASTDEWIYEDRRVGRVFRGWRDARFQGTLALALSARIPLEVFELVIDAMIGDQPALAAAALVCPMWYPRAMQNLYYAVEIRSRTSFNMLFKQCHASPSVKQWLASTYRLLADEEHHTLQALPSALAGVMPRVRIFHLERGDRRFIRTDFFLALSRFKSVKSLTLSRCLFNNITQLRQIVYAFPQLTDLTLDVEIAQQGAASYAGASPFYPSSHIRLRSVEIDVRQQEAMAMFLVWMTHSGLCTSLADLKVWLVYPSATWQMPLNNLLEAAGASLTRYCEILYHDDEDYTHSNLSQNTSLRSWDFTLQAIQHIRVQDKGPRAAWTQATDELHGVLSTIRSHQLEHIAVRITPRFDDDILAPQEPNAVLEALNLRDLHEVMSRPYFDALQDVEVTTYLSHRINHILDVVVFREKLETIFRGLLQPWSARGVVAVTYKHS